MTRLRSALLHASWLAACGNDDPEQSGTTSGPDASSTAASSTVTEAGTTGTTAVADDTGSTTGSPVVYDLGRIVDAPTPEGGCTAIDFLFVIDDSSSMLPHQENLVANFPVFIDGLRSTLDAVDSLHVGITATDAYSFNYPPCILFGALVTETEGGTDSSDMICGPFADGFNFMTEADDLETAFACTAQIGSIGDGFERPMESMVTTLGGSLDVRGGCNEGFLREEALLVVVIITDEYDGPGDPEMGKNSTSLGDPASWYQAVLDAKGGVAENAAALAITNYENGPCPPAELGFDGANIVSWVEMFGDRGVVGGICERDYGPFFEDAIEVVAAACGGFVAPR